MTAPVLQLKRRVTGAAGAPVTLKTGELAWNQVDKTLYGGKGDDGSGNATSIDILGGAGAFVDRTSDQTIAGTKIFSAAPLVPTPTQSGEAANKAYVDANAVSVEAGSGIDIAGNVISADGTIARLASPTFTGTPAAPTAANATNSAQLATTAFVHALIDTVLGTAPAALDTLQELAAALGNDQNFASSVTAALAGKQPLDATLTAFAALAVAADKLVYAAGPDAFSTTDLTAFARTLLDDADAAASRATLGLDSMALQAASSVNITGGSIGANVTIQAPIDGGTF